MRIESSHAIYYSIRILIRFGYRLIFKETINTDNSQKFTDYKPILREER